jgi:hypothetical protein
MIILSVVKTGERICFVLLSAPTFSPSSVFFWLTVSIDVIFSDLFSVG